MAKIVVWDIDRVWYPDISTSYVARESKADYRPVLKHLVEEKNWFSYDNVKKWEESTGREVASAGDVAEMLTHFLYKMKNEVYSGISDQEAKTRTIEGKQALLQGLTMRDVRNIADSVENAKGLSEAVKDLYSAGLAQVGFSDGLGPFVYHKMKQQKIRAGGIVPAVVSTKYGDDIFNLDLAGCMLLDDDVVLTGKTLPFKKSEAIFKFLEIFRYNTSDVAIIDDSVANLVTLVAVKDAGGIALGINVNDEKRFRAAGVPVIREHDLRQFSEIVRDRSKIGEYGS